MKLWPETWRKKKKKKTSGQHEKCQNLPLSSHCTSSIQANVDLWIKWWILLHINFADHLNCSTLPSQPNSPCRYDSLPYPLFYAHSWLRVRPLRAYAQRTPQSSMDRYLPSEGKWVWLDYSNLFNESLYNFYGTFSFKNK